MTLRLLQVVAWVLLGIIVFATLSPIELRPVSGFPVQIERFLAFAVVGGAFAIAYPRHAVLVGLLVIGAAAALEVLQLIDPGRHGRAPDFVAKIAGGVFGLLAGMLVTRLLGGREARSPE